MPKTKTKHETTSDSDSGPEDKNPPPSKKTKSGKEVEVKANSTETGEPSWTLEKLRQVRINTFRGRQSVDIREFYEKDGKLLPGKKGISLTPIQWRKLLEIADEVTKALDICQKE